MRSEMRAARISLTVLVSALLWPGTARADWSLGAFLGQAHTQTSTVVLTLPSQATQLDMIGVHYRGESFRSPQYYGVRVTWSPDSRRWLGLEGEWIHAKVYAEVDRVVQMQGTLRGVPVDSSAPLSSLVQRLAMSHGLNFLLMNVAVRHGLGPVDTRGGHRVMAVVRAGAGPTFPHAESHVDQVAKDQYETGGLGAQVGGGLEYSLWRGLGALGEYKFTWASPEIEVAGGQAKVPARSHHVVFGMTYGF
jgi:hypothetical protein